MKYLRYSCLVVLGLSGASEGTVLSSDGLNLGSVSTNQVDPTPSNAYTGYGAFALGEANTVSSGGVAFGYHNTVSTYSLAIGQDNVSGSESFILGIANTMDVNAWDSLVIGDGNNVGTIQSSAAIGSGNTMGGAQNYSIIFGQGNAINSAVGKNGVSNSILGSSNTISNLTSSDPNTIEGTVLLGTGNVSHSTKSYAIGEGNTALTGTVTLGTYSSPIANASLIVGNGTSGNNRSNVLLAMKDGSVVIPSGNLILNGESALTPSSAQSVIGSHLTNNNYLKRAWGTNASITNGGLLAIGDSATAEAAGTIAIGNGASASTINGIAVGWGAMSIGQYSTVIGSNSATYADASSAFGYNAYAYNEGGLALGYNANSGGNESVALTGSEAIGDNSFASNYGHTYGEYSIALFGGVTFGYGAIAIGGAAGGTNGTGPPPTQGGWGNSADGDYSVALGGFGNAAGGIASYAMGYNSIAQGNYSTSLGYYSRSSAAYEIVLGSKNLSSNNLISIQDLTSWRENEVLFELGNGDPAPTSIEYSNAITTLKNGQTTLTNKAWKQDQNVTPTTNNAGGKALVVEGHAEIQGNAVINGKTVLNGAVVIAQPQGDISMGIYGN